MSRPSNLLPVLCLLFTLGCAGVDPKTDAPEPASSATPQIEERLLQQARTSAEPKRSRLFLDLAQVQAEQHKQAAALASLQQISFDALSDPALRETYVLLGARLSLSQDNPRLALDFLQRAQPPLFQAATAETRREIAELRAQALESSGDPLMAALERIASSGLYQGAEDSYWRNHDAIWRTLSQTPAEELKLTSGENLTPLAQGWLELALSLRAEPGGLDEQWAALQRWRQQWSAHPAAQRLPGELQLLSQLHDERPRNIALTLPLSGPLAAAGNAVRDGFLAAYYMDPQRQNQNIRIQIFDSAQHANYLELYQDIVNRGFELVVGPLDKNAVTQLERLPNLQIPVLALNYSDSPAPNGKPLYQFGLAVEDEIAQIAQQAWQQGHRRVAIIVPDSSWGQRALNSFVLAWETLGGTVLDYRQLSSQPQEYSNQIRTLLGIDLSEQRAREMSRLLGENLKSEPRRRPDLDAIFMAATPLAARQIKPLLAYHYGGDLPVYATSQVFSGRINSKADQDLDGIQFVDIPWTLRPTLSVRSQLQQIWPEQAHERLYALGVDAYRLAPRLDLMRQFPDSTMTGMTGILSLSPDQQIQRGLTWARFRAGRPVLDKASSGSSQ